MLEHWIYFFNFHSAINNKVTAVQEIAEFLSARLCDFWNTQLLELDAIANGVTAFADYAIAVLLLYFVRSHQDVPFMGTFWMFAVFLAASSTTNLLEIFTIWYAVDGLFVSLKLLTAVLSVVTIGYLLNRIPQALLLPSPRQLRASNEQLAREICERKRTEKALQDSERRFRAIFDGTFEYLGLLTPDGTVLEVNYSALDFFGLKYAEVVGCSLWDVGRKILGEKTEKNRKNFSIYKSVRAAIAAAAAGEFVRSEMDLPLANNRLVTIDFSIKPVKDETGNVILLIPEARNISDRKLLERKLALQRQHLSAFFTAAPAGLAIYDNQMRFVQINEKLAEISGQTAAEHIGKSITEVMPEIAPILTRHAQQIHQTGEAISNNEFSFASPTGVGERTWIFSQFPLPGENEKIEAIGLIAVDITEQKIAEASRRESLALFQSIFDGAGVGIALVDMQGRLLTTNPALVRMLGYNENQLRGIYLTDFTHTDDIWESCKYYEQLMSGKRDSYQIEKRYICASGEQLWGNLTVSLVRDSDGNPQFCIGMVQDITERKQAEEALRQYKEDLEELVRERTAEISQINEKLSWQATHDELTRMVNRREFERLLAEAVESAKNYDQVHTLCYLDLDKFKVVNDTCGHLAGDELLRQVSTLLKNRVRKSDAIARIGGDEFGWLLYQCSLPEAYKVAQQVHQSIQEFRFVWQEKAFQIGVSIGMVQIDVNSISLDTVLSAADTACYAAKNQGRNSVHIYRPEDRNLNHQNREMRWVNRIRGALSLPCALDTSLEPFCLYHQPIVSLNHSQQMRDHSEVLVRLLDENGEIIPPMAFIPTAERYNLMQTIDRWVIHTFFKQLNERYSHASVNDSHLARQYAINISVASLQDEKFIDFIQEQFSDYPIPAQIICFEITETVAIQNLTKLVQFIEKIRNLGCRFGLDNFGSGTSSFSYLKHLPVDYLKIDGAFIQDLENDPIAEVMVESIHRIAQVIGIPTVAKFVDRECILQKVRDIGVDYAQGFAIAPPQPLFLTPCPVKG